MGDRKQHNTTKTHTNQSSHKNHNTKHHTYQNGQDRTAETKEEENPQTSAKSTPTSRAAFPSWCRAHVTHTPVSPGRMAPSPLATRDCLVCWCGVFHFPALPVCGVCRAQGVRLALA